LELAYLAVAQYLRSYWWFAAIIPLFGVIALVVGSGVMQAMGTMALLWPLSLPARAIFATTKAGKLMQRGAFASLEDGTLYLHGEDGDGLKLRLERVRRMETRRGFLVFVLSIGSFVALPLRALPEGFEAEAAQTVGEFYR
jgi:hypothetical protein